MCMYHLSSVITNYVFSSLQVKFATNTMTRRKSVCSKWTLVLLVVIVCPSVYTRPQEEVSFSATTKVENEKTTHPPIRYTFSNLSFNSFKLAPKVINFVNETNVGKSKSGNGLAYKPFVNTSNGELETITVNNRTGRLIRTNSRGGKKKYKPTPVRNKSEEDSYDRKKPAIRKVITKWRDKTKLNDLNFSYETSSLDTDVKGTTKFNNIRPNVDSSTEGSSEADSKRYTRPPPNDMYDQYYNDDNMYNNQRPQYPYSEETQAFSPNIQVIHTRPRPTRPPHYHTNIPTPTPIITNLGYPKPWTQQITRKTTTQRPMYNTRPTNYEYHNNFQNYGPNTYEVSTFEPTNSYTDRIVIRPEEYSPTAEDCPTIYLTLNNTFQGQAKEACPDLNIAVNTNVINKNVVVESEEEESESLFPGAFGLDLGDDSGGDSSKDEDYFESEENQEQGDESASVEGTELTNYHSANSVIKPESAESGGFGAASSPSSAIISPGGSGGSDDDIFSFSSLIDFFRPALDALGWLVTINPLSIGLFPLLVAPLGLLFAGSGFAALFAPWFLPYAREAPKLIHVYKPEWRWDDDLKTWQLHSFPVSRRLVPEMGRASTESKKKEGVKPTLFFKLKEWMINVTNRLRKDQRRQIVLNARKTKRKKREAWTQRLKFS